MKREEQETTMTWDYATDTIRVYTTRESVLNTFKHRLGEEYISQVHRLGSTVTFTIPMSSCRKPGYIAKILNPDAKGPSRTEEQKQRRFNN